MTTPAAENPLIDLARSTFAFHDRFGVTPTIEPASRNLLEEVHEFTEAAKGGSEKSHIAEEAADVFVTALGLCRAAGVGVDQLVNQIYAVIDKNDSKSHDTHVYMDGKIRRRKESSP